MSTSTLEPDRAHPISRFGVRVHAALDGLVDAQAWSMSADEQGAALVLRPAPPGARHTRTFAWRRRSTNASSGRATLSPRET